MKLIETIKKKLNFGSEVVGGEGLVAEIKDKAAVKNKSVEDKCDNKRNCVLYQK